MATKTTAKTDVAKTETTATDKTETKVAAPNKTPYRTAPDFLTALKSAKSLAKGNPELVNAVQLVTHLAWKPPTSTVGWTAGTTASVVAYADDLAVPVGTGIQQAMDAALTAAEKAAGTEPQKTAVGALRAIVKLHEGA